MNFIINKDGNLKEKDKTILIETYRNLYANMYGRDMVDAFLDISKKKSQDIKRKKILINYSKNYNHALELFADLENNDNIELLCVYDDKNKIQGAFRLREINEEECSVPDMVFCDVDNDLKYNIFEEGIKYITDYFANLGYEKMYLEIPLKEPVLLMKAVRDLAFIEDPEDIDLSTKSKTYLLNKNIERKKDVKQDSYSKQRTKLN